MAATATQTTSTVNPIKFLSARKKSSNPATAMIPAIQFLMFTSYLFRAIRLFGKTAKE